MAHRVDRLRLAGNGVVPLAAGYAFVSLVASALVAESGGSLSATVKGKPAAPIHTVPAAKEVA